MHVTGEDGVGSENTDLKIEQIFQRFQVFQKCQD